MKPITRYEQLTASQFRSITSGIVRSVGPLGAMIANLGEADPRRGGGVVDGQTKCLWTRDGRRLEVSLIPGGGVCLSCSKEPDPECPKAEGR